MIVMACAGKEPWERSHRSGDIRRKSSERAIGVIANVVWFGSLGYSLFLPFDIQTVWFWAGLILFVPGALLLSKKTTVWDFMMKSTETTYAPSPNGLVYPNGIDS